MNLCKTELLRIQGEVFLKFIRSMALLCQRLTRNDDHQLFYLGILVARSLDLEQVTFINLLERMTCTN